MSYTRRAALAAAFSVVAIAALTPHARAHGYKIGDLEVGHPWTRTTPPSAKVAGGYLSIANKGSMPDRLRSATFTRSASTEVHEMTHEGGIMKMRELPDGIEIKPGQRVNLQPGGFHLMFIGLKEGLKEGETFNGTLVFEKAGSIEVGFKVEAMGYKPKGADTEHDHSAHGAKTQ
jgi:periplasmic copper chaperone A